MDYKTYDKFLQQAEGAKPGFKGFCHIAPTPHLDTVDGRPIHLALAHLVETDPAYVEFYNDQKHSTIILDNSAFEMYKQGRPMYPSDKLIEMGKMISADYVVMSDYPGEHSSKTIDAARELAPKFKAAGFGIFFVPQSQVGDLDDLLNAYKWASVNPELVDYIGVSILGVPNAYGVEKDNKLQRFTSRLHWMYTLHKQGVLQRFYINRQKIHMLGMVDGPNEIMFMKPFKEYITSWDSSAAVWKGLNNQTFDLSPTGSIDGKLEKEVDFNFSTDDDQLLQYARQNVDYIDYLCKEYLY